MSGIPVRVSANPGQAPRPRFVSAIGIDISLSGTGVVVLRGDWDPAYPWHPGSVVGSTYGYNLLGPDSLDPEARARRLEAVANFVANAVGSIARREPDPPAVWCEDHVYGLAPKRGVQLAELHGAVKVAVLRDLGIAVVPVNVTTARRLLVGRGCSKKGVKAALHRRLLFSGAPFRNDNESDAFAVANYARSELGLPAMTLAGRED